MDDDLDTELEIDELVTPEGEPLGQTESNANAGDEGQETQEGLGRLIDFLKEKTRLKQKRKPGPVTKSEIALNAYQRASEGVEELRGQKIDLKK